MAGGPAYLSFMWDDLNPDFALVKLIENGLPLESIDALKELGLTSTEISEIIIQQRTLKRRKAHGKLLTCPEGERVVRIMRIIQFADNVFGSHETAMNWLRDHDDQLNNCTALQMLTTEAGGRLVHNMLGQIDEGIFA